MTDQQPHTPTTDEMRKLYLLKVPHDQRDRRSAEFDRFIAAAEQRGAIKALRVAQQIIAGDMTIAEQRGRRGADKIDAAYLIRELDQEIQDLQEPGHD